MKYINIKSLIILSFLFAFYACEKENIEIYKQNAGIYFTYESDLQELSYSFFSNPGISTDTIQIPVNITGDSSAVERVFTAELVEGSNSTVTPDMYEIIGGVVPSGSFVGTLSVQVNKTDDMDNDVFSIELMLVPSEDFQVVDLAISNYKLNLTSLMVKPDNWDFYCSLFFGIYSEKWYSFIVENTGDSNIGATMSADFLYWYNMGNSASDVIGWFPDPTMDAYHALVKKALRDYNNGPNGPLTHDDGSIVEMP